MPTIDAPMLPFDFVSPYAAKGWANRANVKPRAFLPHTSCGRCGCLVCIHSTSTDPLVCDCRCHECARMGWRVAPAIRQPYPWDDSVVSA